MWEDCKQRFSRVDHLSVSQWLASIYFVICVVLTIAIRSSSGYLGALGVTFGWLYLRFWQKETENTGEGRMDPTFGFASFFPEACQPAAGIFGTVIFNLAAMCGIVKKRVADPVESAHKFYSNESSSLGTNPAIAERRRQQAQQELEARLAQVGNQDIESLDNLLDDAKTNQN